ncbi:hypothetical protein L9F63_007060, partial [Diploptera punctata]
IIGMISLCIVKSSYLLTVLLFRSLGPSYVFKLIFFLNLNLNYVAVFQPDYLKLIHTKLILLSIWFILRKHYVIGMLQLLSMHCYFRAVGRGLYFNMSTFIFNTLFPSPLQFSSKHQVFSVAFTSATVFDLMFLVCIYIDDTVYITIYYPYMTIAFIPLTILLLTQWTYKFYIIL